MTTRTHLLGIFFLLTILNIHTKLIAQTTEMSFNSALLEVKPSFPGGINEFYKYVGKNFKTPNIPDLDGKVYATFVIDHDGSVVDIKILRDIGHGTREEAIRVLNESPKWTPGRLNKKTVRVLYSFPISIKTQKKSETVYLTKEAFEKPSYPGGIQNFYTDLGKIYKTPNIEGLKGKIYVSFIIETDGEITNKKIIKDIGYGTGEEALRCIALLKNWTPGKLQDGTIVRTTYSLPITIQSED